MKAADEPAYLTVGTDVSAKYRGAFCEAKIKTVKRMVKVKVMLKGDTTSQVVQDDQVKGPLRVGSTVEVKSAEGICSEATINKLTDASWYTVVFDDGDEKTLRRTSLCLKGERHFAESETLDQLPLTNPEHFGTPVIGKKGNRGGRSADDEKESSSSEDESEDRRRLNDDLLGKVASIQPGSDRTCWYLALVISPSCNDDLTVKKDQCLVRSFGDSKFHTVARKDVHEVNIDVLSKPEYSSRKGLDGAVHFLKTKVVPDSWKMDMSEILESSSSDDEEMEGKESEEEEEEEEEDEEKEDVSNEPEDESDPEERDHFLQQLYKFMEDRGTPINKPPVLGYKDLNLFKLFRLVYHQGGCDNIESGSVWKQIYMDLGIPVLNSAASYNVKTAYRKYLYGFEEYCRSASIVFRTIHHNEACPAPPAQTEQKATHLPEAKDEEEEEGQGSAATIKTEPATATEDEPALEEPGSESDSDKEGRKDLSCHRGRRRCTVTPVKAEVKEPAKLEKIKEEKEEQSGVGLGEPGGEETGGQRDCIRPDGGDNPGKRRSRRLEESDKESEGDGDDDDEDDEEDEEDRERRVRERGEGEEDDSEDSVTGTKVKVKYGRGKTQKIYEANIKKAENDDAGDVLYLVHYYGWNVRYDEWVKADRIIWPVDKGGTKKNQKKKVKNKEDGEREEDKQGKLGGVKRGRPHLRTTPPNTNRSVSKTPSSEGRSSSKSKSEASALPNGEGTPRRRTRRTSGMYDSDRDANSNEESGNSSEDSESEDSPESKPAWAERTDPATARKQEEEEDRRVERGRAEAALAEAAAQAEAQAQPLKTIEPPAKMETREKVEPPENTDPPEQDEPRAQNESPVKPEDQHLQEKKLPEIIELKEERKNEEELDEERTLVPPMSPEPDRPKAEDLPTSKSPRSKAARRSNAREPERNNNTDSETPTATPNYTETESSPCPHPLKRQDEPMVILRCLPAEHLLNSDFPSMDSDTDSATEEICREDRAVTKRKATEQKTSDKKLRLDKREDTTYMASPARRPIDSPGRRITDSPVKRPTDSPVKRPTDSPVKRPTDSPVKRPTDSPVKRPTDSPVKRPTDSPVKRPTDSPVKRPTDSPVKRPSDSPEQTIETGGLKGEERLTPAEVKTEMPALTPEVQCRSPEEDGVSCRTQSEQLCVGAEEELIPQIGPEALVCHEVDLDDLDEKDKTSAEDLLMMMSQGKVHAPPPSTANSHHSQTHIHPPVSEGTAPLFSPTSAPSPEESHSTKSESDVTIEVDSVAGESQEGLGDNESANSNCFEASTSSSNSSMSLPERDTKDRGQKRLMDCNMTSSAKKQKRNQKRPSTTSKMDKNGAGHSSDSEDLAVMDSSNKLTPVKQSMSKGSQKLSRSPGVVSPHSKELEKDKHKDKQSSFPSPRTYKWTLQLNELDNMTSAERISFLQDKLKDIKKYYMTLKSEVASIDRRRKRLKKKEREVSHTTASTSSGSSDTGMSPSSASPTQNTVAVECR
ncbi:AT-rich interactive domain-containing protein 4A isoform X2 [Esox lucius]|uniref:AT-rich interactive domain-containing protein 4A isoform X2 n=1 Tax=Esox lucius TaxID=8010 RepID=UPI001476F635|nr:AT-rich interactive domain-containing protein 4A isoform X2 [Esox lucius]